MKNAETANRITANILKTVNFQPGCYAFRVNTTGIWDEKKQVFRTSAQRGTADVLACIHGMFYAFEVKAGKDAQRDSQKEFQFFVEKAKGKYFLIRSTDEFLLTFTGILQFVKYGKNSAI